MDEPEPLEINLSRLTIGVSPLTNNIYLGIEEKEGVFKEKTEVTEEVLGAVAMHMDDEYSEIDFPAGTLKWEPNEDEEE